MKILLIFETFYLTERNINSLQKKPKQNQTKTKPKQKNPIKSLFNLVHVKKIDSKGKDAL